MACAHICIVQAAKALMRLHRSKCMLVKVLVGRQCIQVLWQNYRYKYNCISNKNKLQSYPAPRVIMACAHICIVQAAKALMRLHRSKCMLVKVLVGLQCIQVLWQNYRYIWEIPKWALLQTVKTRINCSIMLHFIRAYTVWMLRFIRVYTVCKGKKDLQTRDYNIFF